MSGLPVENKVVVRIFGEEYPITGADDSAYIARVADLVDSRMQDVARQSRSQARDKIAILTALSLASELLEQSDRVQQISGQSESSLDDMLARLDEALSSR